MTQQDTGDPTGDPGDPVDPGGGPAAPTRHAARRRRRMRRIAAAVLTPFAILTIAGMVWLWPSGTPLPDQGGPPETVEALVTGVEREQCPQTGGDPQGVPVDPGAGGQPQPDDGGGAEQEEPLCGTAEVELQAGDQAGETVRTQLNDAPGATQVDVGDDVLVAAFEYPDGTQFVVVDQQRGSELIVLAIAFVLAVVAFGRWRGLSAIGGLAVSFAVLLFFVVPGILDGRPPLLVAIVGSAAIALTVLYLTHGPSVTTSVAVLGTLSSLTLAALLSSLSIEMLHLTGFSDDLATYVGTTYQVNTEGLLLAGIVIGSLGVLDDITVTQAETVKELGRSRPDAGVRELYLAGTRVGRAHVASVVNTIILAYAGTSLPLLIIVIANGGAFSDVLTDQLIAQEIVRSAVATIGLVAAVPVTTVLAALAVNEMSPAAQD